MEYSKLDSSIQDKLIVEAKKDDKYLLFHWLKRSDALAYLESFGISKDSIILKYLDNFSYSKDGKVLNNYRSKLLKARESFIGLSNTYGTVVAVYDPEIQSSDSYDSELVFSKGYENEEVCHGVRWKVMGGKGKQSYYQSDDYNLK